jgi:hypothetical protein
MLATLRGDAQTAFAWMAYTIFVDAIDGTLARHFEVKRVMPTIDGARLDDCVDYFTYVVVPVFFMVHTGMLPASLAAPVAALVLVASLFGFGRTDAKTDDHFFTGFPSYWNITVFYLWVLQWPGWASALLSPRSRSASSCRALRLPVTDDDAAAAHGWARVVCGRSRCSGQSRPPQAAAKGARGELAAHRRLLLRAVVRADAPAASGAPQLSCPPSRRNCTMSWARNVPRPAPSGSARRCSCSSPGDQVVAEAGRQLRREKPKTPSRPMIVTMRVLRRPCR